MDAQNLAEVSHAVIGVDADNPGRCVGNDNDRLPTASDFLLIQSDYIDGFVLVIPCYPTAQQFNERPLFATVFERAHRWKTPGYDKDIKLRFGGDLVGVRRRVAWPHRRRPPKVQSAKTANSNLGT